LATSSFALSLAFISEGFPLWALYVAEEQLLFARGGLGIKVTHTGSSVKQVEGLENGLYDLGLQLPDHVIRSVEKGSDLCIIGAQAHAPDVALVADPQILDLDQLMGKSIGVDGVRTGYALLLTRLLYKAGWKDEHFVLTEIGGTTERIKALEAGEISACFVNPPFDQLLIKQGFVRLASTRESFPEYPGPVVAGRRNWIDRHRDVVDRFIDGWRNAFCWLIDAGNRETAIQIACARLNVSIESAALAFDELGERGIPEVTIEGMEAVIDLVWKGEESDRPRPPPGRYLL
jgi:ABC-type nitrate/sulfonate/bicarbonate transport system substrate-binding protein